MDSRLKMLKGDFFNHYAHLLKQKRRPTFVAFSLKIFENKITTYPRCLSILHQK